MRESRKGSEQDPVQEKAQKIARDIIQISQGVLLSRMRFLDVAIFRLEPEAVWSTGAGSATGSEGVEAVAVGVEGATKAEGLGAADSKVAKIATFGTDGKTFYYNAGYVLKAYGRDADSVTRGFLHSLLHCLFLHPFSGHGTVRAYWDFASDVAVEVLLDELGFPYKGGQADQRSQVLKTLRAELPSLTAERIYHYCQQARFSADDIAAMAAPFYEDDHGLWYDEVKPVLPQIVKEKSGKLGSGGKADENSELEEGETIKGAEAKTGTTPMGDQVPDDGGKDIDTLPDQWEKISRNAKVDLETTFDQHGEIAGTLTQALEELHREKYDYSEFLRKFAVFGEELMTNDDAFDYIYYTYGIALYGDMPLIEPLEYKEVKKVKQFVIAIDTSGSTSGQLVQSFLQKTYNILLSQESFFKKINVHIIQCDAQIQEAVQITSREEFEDYIDNFQIMGLGGTDFRPAFRYVDDLVERGELDNLKGMIYFTDGFGEFPSKPPAYETAFVFIRNGYWNPKVPPWAIKLVLERDELLEES